MEFKCEQCMPHCLLCQVGVRTKDSRAIRELVIALLISACPWFTFLADDKAENVSDAYFVDMENLPFLQAKRQYCHLH